MMEVLTPSARKTSTVQALRERIHTHIRERLDATAPNLADLQRAELAAVLGGAVWAALL